MDWVGEKMFGKKKKDAPKEEPVVTKVQEATEHEPAATAPPAPEQPAQELTPEQQRTSILVRYFAERYDGVVAVGADTVRANLQFATFAEVTELVEHTRDVKDELHELNANIKELIELVKKQG